LYLCISHAGIQYDFDKMKYTYMHHSWFYECRQPDCRVVLALLVDSREFSAACINAPVYLPSRYSLLSPWRLKSSVRARGAFQSLATCQHKVEEKILWRCSFKITEGSPDLLRKKFESTLSWLERWS